MNLKTDYHTHTTFSFDGHNTPDEMCAQALKLGYDTIALTEHAEWITGQGGLPRAAEYIEAVEACRQRYEPLGLRVLSGVELGNPHDYEFEVDELLSQHPFEMRIASLHWLYGENIHLAECFQGLDPHEVYTDYFTELGNMATLIDAEIVAHFDRIFLRGLKMGARPRLDRLESVIRDALVTIAWRGMALELNTRYLRHDPSWQHELTVMLRWFRDEGGERVVINSDAHRIEQIGLNGDLAMTILQEAGFEAPARLPVATRTS